VFRSLFLSLLTALQTAWFTELDPLSCVNAGRPGRLELIRVRRAQGLGERGWRYE
jgi:hypothetical protein